MRSGAYREPIIFALKDTDPKLADLFRKGDIKFAIVSGITGCVTIRRDLIDTCLCALEKAKQHYPEEAAYYMDGLLNGLFVPAMTAGVNYIATGASAEEAMKKQAQVVAAQPERVYARGELFFTS
jgi:hypothetical protein